MSEETDKSDDARGAHNLPPLFISGRQHSGNTLVAVIIGLVDGCWSQTNENVFFERRGVIDSIADDKARAFAVADEMRIDDIDREEAARAREHLGSWVAAHPGATALDLYIEGMRSVLERSGHAFWVQKATSYIFYIEEIFRDIPDAKMVFLQRNLYDIGASRKKRLSKKKGMYDPFAITAISWNKGFRIAKRMAQQHPDRFIMLRYEDLASDPERAMSRVFEFLGIPFSASYLDVPHINPAEKQFTRQDVADVTRDTLAKGKAEKSPRSGINVSRLYYYRDQLTKMEIAILDLLVDKKLVEEFYPELPHSIGGQSLVSKLKAVCWLLLVPIRIVNTYALSKNVKGFSIGWIIARVRRRVFNR